MWPRVSVFVYAISLVTFVQIGAATQQTPPLTLTTARAAHNLTSDEANRHHPVVLRATVTYFEPDPTNKRGTLFVADATGCIWVELSSEISSPLTAGQLVEIHGSSSAGHFAPIVDHATARVIGTSAVPLKAESVSVTQLRTGRYDGQWIEIAGVVRSVNSIGTGLLLEVGMADGLMTAMTIGTDNANYENLVDKNVRIRGNQAPIFNHHGQMTGARVMFSGLNSIRTSASPSSSTKSPFDLPTSRIHNLLRFTPNGESNHRMHVRGTLTLFWPGKMLCLQDDGWGLCAQTTETKSLPLTEGVDLIGFPEMGEFSPTMARSSYRAFRPGQQVRPKSVVADDILAGDLDMQLVAVKGRVVDEKSTLERSEIILSSDNHVFSGVLPTQPKVRSIPTFAPGTLLRVVGICSYLPDPDAALTPAQFSIPKSFRVMLRSAADVSVLEKPSWWTAQRTLAVLSATLAVTLGVICWAVLLNRQVHGQTSIIRAQLREAEELRTVAESSARAKSEFLANMSHELRTPLNGVLGMTELAAAEIMTPKAKAYLEIAQSSGATLLQVINDILDLSKIEAGRMTVERAAFDLHQLLAQVIQLLTPSAENRNLVLTLQYPNGAPKWFLGDSVRIRQIVLNLVSNALKFTLSGSIVIEVLIRPGEQDEMSLRISVRDTGIGIPLDVQDRLFESFTQADASTTRRFGGTGLGLAISRHLCTLMNGSIGLTSTPGNGSTFWFEIPAAGTEPLLQVQDLPTPSSTNLPITRVLLAEDNIINQKVAIGMLEKLNVQVDIVDDGLKAVAKFKEHRYAMVFMDCQMPLCDGFNATKQIREWELQTQNSYTPIVALTAHAFSGDRDRCLESGMDDFLTKPLSAGDLRRVIERWALSAAA